MVGKLRFFHVLVGRGVRSPPFRLMLEATVVRLRLPRLVFPKGVCFHWIPSGMRGRSDVNATCRVLEGARGAFFVSARGMRFALYTFARSYAVQGRRKRTEQVAVAAAEKKLDASSPR